MSNDQTPKVTFVVVNWNQKDLTLDCLASLRQQEFGKFDVIVVDNGSQDGSVTAIRAGFPEVCVLENSTNLGIAAANNIGIRQALDCGTDYVFLLNNDTTVHPSMLNHLVSVAESQPDIGTVGPTMLYYDDPEIVWCAGNSIDWRTGSTARLWDRMHLGSLEEFEDRTVDFVTSCAACIKAAVFHKVGLMDERYFIYYDETDWFVRASEAGFRTVYVPRAKMWHKVSASMGTTSPATDYYFNRNMLLFLSKHRRGLARIRSLVLAGGRHLLTIATYTVKSHGGKRLPHRNARLLALRDALLGRWGKMGPDVEAVCYPDSR